MNFFDELKRRNVFRVGIAYVIIAWILAQVADLFLENFNAPDWVIQSVLLVLVIGFPLALFLAWVYELTPEGVKKERDVDRSRSITTRTGRRLDFAIIALLAMALGYFVWESRFARSGSTIEETRQPDSIPSTEISPPARQDSAPAATNPVPSPHSIAVLPFVNMSMDAENEFFSDGVSEEILNVLARIPELKVAARTSAFAYKGTPKNIREIAGELKVSNVLEGSVRKAGDQVRVTAQLIKADDGFHLWSDTYDRKLDNIFEIQDEIANSIAEALKVTLDLETGTSGNLTGTTSIEAYEYYLQGMASWHLRTPANLYSAIEDFNRAIDIDPDFARAHAGAALAWTVLPGYIDHDVRETQTKTREHADRALQIDPGLAEAYAALGNVAMDTLDFDGSRALYERAIELNPSFATAYQWMARLLGHTGDLDEALVLYRKAWDLDPRSRIIGYNYAWDLMRSYRRDEAVQTIEAVLEYAPDFPDAHETALLFGMIMGDCQTVAAHAARLVQLLGKNQDASQVYLNLCEAESVSERTAIVQEILDWPWNSFAQADSPVLHYEYELATTLVEMGLFDSALVMLERHIDESPGILSDVTWYRSIGSPNGRQFSCDPRASLLFEQLDLPPRPEHLECE